MTYALRVIVGIPGSGKTTYVQAMVEYLEAEHFTTAVISRDAVRKSFVGDNANQDGTYFNREDEVFNEFIRQINEAMEIGINYVFVDATHISPGSRAKLLNRLLPDPYTSLVFDVIDTPANICKERNAQRTGFARVPDSAMDSMIKGFKRPTDKEISQYAKQYRSTSINFLTPEVKV